MQNVHRWQEQIITQSFCSVTVRTISSTDLNIIASMHLMVTAKQIGSSMPQKQTSPCGRQCMTVYMCMYVYKNMQCTTVKIINNYFIYVEKDRFCVMHFTTNERTQEHVIALHLSLQTPKTYVTDITVSISKFRKSPTGGKRCLTVYRRGGWPSQCFCFASQIQNMPVGKTESPQRGRTSLKLCLIFMHRSSLMLIVFASFA